MKHIGYRTSEHVAHTSCAICMVDYNEQDDVIILPCNSNHYFHSLCVEEFLKVKSECPLCRAHINPDGTTNNE